MSKTQLFTIVIAIAAAFMGVGCQSKSNEQVAAEKFMEAAKENAAMVEAMPNPSEAADMFTTMLKADFSNRPGDFVGGLVGAETSEMVKTAEGWTLPLKSYQMEKTYVDEQGQYIHLSYTYKATYTAKDKQSGWTKQNASVTITDAQLRESTETLP